MKTILLAHAIMMHKLFKIWITTLCYNYFGMKKYQKEKVNDLLKSFSSYDTSVPNLKTLNVAFLA